MLSVCNMMLIIVFAKKKINNNQIKCKNDADRKMVKELDLIPRNERQWGHTVARNAIAAKAKIGLGAKKQGKSKNVKSR